jgi:hypothetical protein
MAESAGQPRLAKGVGAGRETAPLFAKPGATAELQEQHAVDTDGCQSARRAEWEQPSANVGLAHTFETDCLGRRRCRSSRSNPLRSWIGAAERGMFELRGVFRLV